MPSLPLYIKMINGQWKLSAKHFFDRPLLRDLQTDYANAMSHWKLDRGVKNSKAKHEKISKLYGEMNEVEKLAKEAIKEFEKPDISEISIFNFKDKIKNFIDMFDSMKEKITEIMEGHKLKEANFKKRTDKYKRTVDALNNLIEENHGMSATELKNIKDENSDLKTQLDAKDSQYQFQLNKVNELQEELNKPESELVSELRKANQKLHRKNEHLQNIIDGTKYDT